ncbi:MAG: DNA internalization-related competence protein ComEC/Rec2, partial [Caldilineae bacterium]
GFSYRDYLARRGVYAMMRRARITLLEPQGGFSLRAEIYRLKERANAVIARILPQPEAALLSGILLGLRSSIPRDLYDQFNATGTSHVIVISGSNISLVVGLLLLVGEKLLGRRRAAFLALLGVTLYTVMVGADAAVVRAAIMGALYVLAMVLGRPNAVLNALFASALAMTIANPLTLWDAGFQLSFLATLGLIVLVPPLERLAAGWLTRLDGTPVAGLASDMLKEALLVTLAAQIITAPLILYQFGRFSLVSLPANLFIVPVQPLVMSLGGLATLAGLVSVPLGIGLGWLAWLPLTWTVRVVEAAAALRWAQVELPPMPLWLLALAYLTLAAGVWWLYDLPAREGGRTGQRRGSNRMLAAAGGALALAMVVWIAARSVPDGKLHVAFLDVGQGDAVLITTPGGRQMLVDGGPSPAQLGVRLGEEMPFWDHSLDVVVSTHPDADHLTGLLDVLNRYRVDTVLVSDFEGQSALFEEWQTELNRSPARVVEAWQGMHLQLDDGVEAVVLNPGPATAADEAANNHSVTLKIQMGDVSFLLSGDLEMEGERALLQSGQDVRATVFKSPHHGSKTGSSLPFLEAVHPQVVVISVGADNRFGHPAEVVLQRYADLGLTVLRTDQMGTVELITDGQRLWLDAPR